MSSEARRPIEEMLPIARHVVDLLSPFTDWIEIGGSIRRGKATVKDIEIIALPHGGSLAGHHSLIQATDALLAQGVIEQSRYGESQATRWGTRYRGFIYEGARVELWMCDLDNRGYIHWLRTGPDSEDDRANTTVASLIKAKAPFSVKSGYVWYGERKLHVPDEETWFALLGMKPVETSKRTRSIYRTLGTRSHRWGDAARYLKTEATMHQHMLGGLHWADIDDIGIHYAADARAPRPANAITAADPEHVFRWQTPWLRGNGMVIIRDWRGNWGLARPEQDEAEQYRQQLERMSSPLLGAEVYALNTLLREQWTAARLLRVMERTVELLRSVA